MTFKLFCNMAVTQPNAKHGASMYIALLPLELKSQSLNGVSGAIMTSKLQNLD